MSARAEILANTLAHLEAERFEPRPVTAAHPRRDTLPPVTAAEAAHNRRVLADAIGGDLHAIEWNERSA